MKKQLELMAPAGNFPMLVSAIKAGADAVYFGLDEFSMRATSKNFAVSDLDEMRLLADESERKVRLYLTLNTIIYDEEVEKVGSILQGIKGKVDAVICWDHAVMQLCNKYEVPFFVSTQASVANRQAAQFYKDIGAKRVVLARELSLEQIEKIADIIEIECFVHGAMCVAISGRCFMSEFTYNKSANRGECYQNCRRSYTITDEVGHELKVENSQVMSAKDLCTLEIIPHLKKAGVTSFKIEGRGRDPRYVDVVTRVYRKALDKDLSEAEIETGMVELRKVFNRDFSTGFYLGKPTDADYSQSENNEATEIKLFLGKIVNYYTNAEVASVIIQEELSVGDEIIVIGKTTGLERKIIDSLQINGSEVKRAVKGDEVGFKMPKVRRNDEVYVIRPR